ETDFLAFSLPDAIATSLSRIGSLIVRSSATAARFAGEAPDLKALAAEADVDRVVTGTLLRSGDQLRAAAQLVETPGGTLLTSHTVQSPLGDLFRLQDDIARLVVEALALPLGGGEDSPTPPAPRNPRLSVAHTSYAALESETGQTQRALVRLLGEADRHGNDPELFAGLVHACRYCGLYEHAIAAHEEARRLDPNVPTSFEQTLLMTTDIERLLALGSLVAGGADEGIRVIGLGLAGRRDEARAALRAMRRVPNIPVFQSWTEYL